MSALDIDFSVLDDPNFKEDSVREEILCPALHYIGYRPDREPKIVRSKVLAHPYVMLGSSSRKISIIPDYILYNNGKPRIVIDAKAPGEDIFKGDNVFQAYSYAIHPEVRTMAYGLCNGRHLNLFHLSSTDPVRSYKLDTMTDLDWEDMRQVMSEREIQRIESFDMLLDFGVCFTMLGFPADTPQMFFNLPVGMIGKISDELYALNIKGDFMHDRVVLLTADVGAGHMRQLMEEMPDECRKACLDGISTQPFSADISRFGYCATFCGKLSSTIEKSFATGEQFRPIIVEKVFTAQQGDAPEPATHVGPA